jgi:hypothetical protein
MSPASTTLDELEAAMVGSDCPRVDCPIHHAFLPGIYCRQIHIPAGTLVTSMEHRFAHPFIISKGSIQVISATEGSVTYHAPWCDITEPGTRRALYAITDVVWTTFHQTDETDVEKACESVLAPHFNHLLADNNPALEAWRTSIPKIPAP